MFVMPTCMSATQTPELHFHLTNYIITMPPRYPTGKLHLMYPKQTHPLLPHHHPYPINSLPCVLCLSSHLLRFELCPSKDTLEILTPSTPEYTNLISSAKNSTIAYQDKIETSQY